MQSGRHDATSRNLRIATECCTGTRADHHAGPDTRRFAGIFPLEVPEAVSVDSSDTTQEEQNDSDDLSRFKFVAAFDKNSSTTQATSLASADESSTLSAAQRVIACYRAVDSSNHAPECTRTETREKVLPRIPDDQRSMYTLATSTSTQSAMDMMWRPKPKVHMCRGDQRALMQAQSQAIAMMHNAGLKPTNRIQCRRQGCADILPDVEALKYHLHIHNIADSTARRRDTSPFATRKPTSLVECSTSNSETLKRNHFRSKSSLGTRHKCSTTFPLPRKLSAGSLLPSLFSTRESTSEVLPVPSFTTVAKAFTPGPNPNKLAGSVPVCNDETPSSYNNNTSTLLGGRGKRKESVAVSVGTECSSGIAMLLSPPSPILHGRPVLAPRVKLPIPVPLGPSKDTENDNCVSIQNGSAYPVSEQLTGSRSPVRALSPTRAMSPIRNGIKRILTLGCPDNVLDK